MGTSKKDLLEQPKTVVNEVGFALHQIQQGETPENVEPFKQGGSGVMEIRVDFDSDTYRTMYVAKLTKGIYALHSFQKKSKKGKETPPKDVAKIQARYKEALESDRK